jgi:hypothetical protein
MAPFINAAQWLLASSPNVYVDGAPQYPATVPLLQVWSAILLGAGRTRSSICRVADRAHRFAIYGYPREKD